MKALQYEGAKELRLIEIPIPEPKEDEVRIKVKAVAICGSDLNGYKGVNSLRVAPLIMGHEFSGEIDCCGEKVKKLKKGVRVTVNPTLYCGECENCLKANYNLCDKKTVPGTSVGKVNVPGAMAEYICVREKNVIPLLDSITFEEAAMLEPMGVSLHGVKRAGNLKNQKVAVIGAGPIGLMAIQCICNFQAEEIVCMDLIDRRLQASLECGADRAINLKADALPEEKFDVVFDCVGNEKTITQAAQIVRNDGKIIVIGMAASEIHFPIKKFVANEFKMYGSYQYLDEMKEAMELLANKKIDVKKMITSVLPLEKAEDAFESLCSPETKEIKIVLKP